VQGLHEKTQAVENRAETIQQTAKKDLPSPRALSKLAPLFNQQPIYG
jgi:16S rRNA G527 N7-methylase RsmG